jgi:hypothetical protein
MRPPYLKRAALFSALQAFAIAIFKSSNGKKYKLLANKYASTLHNKKQKALNICNLRTSLSTLRGEPGKPEQLVF